MDLTFPLISGAGDAWRTDRLTVVFQFGSSTWLDLFNGIRREGTGSKGEMEAAVTSLTHL